MTAKLNLTQFAGHTPGPWTAKADYISVRVMAHCGEQVCGTVPVSEANARLIAAAPALLAECRRLQAENARLRGALEMADEYLNGPPFIALHGDVPHRKARAALKGAE